MNQMKKEFGKLPGGCFFIRQSSQGLPVDYAQKLSREIPEVGNAYNFQRAEIIRCSLDEIVEVIPQHTFMRIFMGAYGATENNHVAKIAREIRIYRGPERRSEERECDDSRLPRVVLESSRTDPETLDKIRRIFRGTPVESMG